MLVKLSIIFLAISIILPIILKIILGLILVALQTANNILQIK